MGWSTYDRNRAILAWAERSGKFRHHNAAVHFLRVLVCDPAHNPVTVAVSPGGAIAGVLARSDETRGVWKAPAEPDSRPPGV